MPTPTWEFHCTHCGDTWVHETMPGTAQMLWFNAKKALRSQIPQPQDPLICETCLLLLREAPNRNFSRNPFLEKEGEAFKHSPVRPRPSLSRSLSFSGHSNENLSVGEGEDGESSKGKTGATLKYPIEMPGRVPDSGSSEEALVAPQSRRVSIITWMVGLVDSAATRSSGGGGAANSQTSAAGSSALQTPDVEDWLQDIRISSPTLNLSPQNLGQVIQSTSSQGNGLDPPQPASQGGQKDMQEARGFFLDGSYEEESGGSSDRDKEDINLEHTTLEDLQRIEAELPEPEAETEPEDEPKPESQVKEPKPMLEWFSSEFIGPSCPISSDAIVRNTAMILKVRQFFAIPYSVPTSQIPSFYRQHLKLQASMEFGRFMLSDEVLVSAIQSHRREIENMCAEVFWADEDEGRVSKPELDVSGEANIGHKFGVAIDNPHKISLAESSSRLTVIQLDEDDERAFQEAMLASEVERTRLATQTQRPRLQEDPANRHTVRTRSSLREEVIALDVIENSYDDDESF